MKSITFFILLLILSNLAQGQSVYWVIESNVKSLDQTTVKVYDLSNALIGEYQFDRRITLASKRDKRMLNRIADRAARNREEITAKRSRRPRALSRS